MAMKPLMINVTVPQDVWLRAEALRLGISVADVVRRIIDAHRDAVAPVVKYGSGNTGSWGDDETRL